MCKEAVSKVIQYPESYRLIREENIQEINGMARLFEHIQTGAKIIYLSNHDDNKVFTIGFRTPSDDSTGVAHIMEHSVLCGSDKYPLKEPFVELIKGSLNTFLNAMTYPDKTVYPVASTNDKDFMNLMDVYLDAVFHPAIYSNPEIFMQEGWHYHLENPEDPITYNGVVYNEMKGVYSNPEDVLENLLLQALYPDTIYRGESGGHPDSIPNLTYDDFLDFHRRYYHPSNSYIYFYGDGDIFEHLDYLDRAYLSDYQAQPADSVIPFQQPFKVMHQQTATYPVSEGESTDGKDYLAFGWVMPEEQDLRFSNMSLSRYEAMLALDILGHILLENNSAPLKKALIEMDLCKEVDYGYATSFQQPYFSIVFKNTSAERKSLFEEKIREILESLVRNGLDADDVEAGINTAEFSLREGESGNYPKGLVMGLELFDTWLYDNGSVKEWENAFPAFDHLKYNAAIAHIRELAKNHGFETLIEQCFLKNAHCALAVLTPDVNMMKQQEVRLINHLLAVKADMDEDEIEVLVEKTRTLLLHQKEEDSPEALATIPKLELNEIDPKPRQYAMEEERFGDHILLWHPVETNGIVYVKLIFDIHSIPQEMLQDLSLFNKLLGELETEDYTLEELTREMEICTGGISTVLSTTDHTVNTGEYRVNLSVKGKAMVYQVSKLMTLMESILQRTCFTDDQTIHTLIREIRMDKEQRFLTAGHAVGVQRLQSYYSQSAALYDVIGGMDFYHYIVYLDENFENCIDDLKERLFSIRQRVFNRENMILSLTCEPENKPAVLAAVDEALSRLPDKAEAVYHYHFDLEKQNEGYQTAAKIQYVCKGYNYRMLGYDYTGSLAVLKSLLYTGYLWTRVRVQGGAYGGSFGVNRAGELYFASYRDPHLKRTLAVYDQTADYIADLEISQRELEKVIIGTISSKDMPLSPPMMTDAVDTMYFNGTTTEMLQKERNEILHTSVEDLRSLAPLVAACTNQNALCVIGGEEAIAQCRDQFITVKNIFNTESQCED